MNIKLELHINTVNVVLAGLAKLPWEHSNPAIVEIQRQTQEQLKPQAVPEPSEKVDAG